MFAWLFGRSRKGPGRAPFAQSSGSKRLQTHERARPKPITAAFFEELGSLTSMPALTDEDERQIVQLCEMTVAYVKTYGSEPPVMPALASRVMEMCAEPEVDVHKLTRLIEQDQAISTRLLSVANSARYARTQEVVGVRDAIVQLGVTEAAKISLALSSQALFDVESRVELAADWTRWNRLFHHGVTTAFASAAFAMQRTKRYSEEAFVGGLFHDVGKVVSLRAITGLMLAGEVEPPGALVIDEAMHRLHKDQSSGLYDNWRLARRLIDFCTCHHELSSGGHGRDLHIVRLVSALDSLRAGSPAEKRDALSEVRESAQQLDATEAELRALRTEVGETAARVERMLPSG